MSVDFDGERAQRDHIHRVVDHCLSNTELLTGADQSVQCPVQSGHTLLDQCVHFLQFAAGEGGAHLNYRHIMVNESKNSRSWISYDGSGILPLLSSGGQKRAIEERIPKRCVASVHECIEVFHTDISDQFGFGHTQHRFGAIVESVTLLL